MNSQFRHYLTKLGSSVDGKFVGGVVRVLILEVVDDGYPVLVSEIAVKIPVGHPVGDVTETAFAVAADRFRETMPDDIKLVFDHE